MNSLTKKSKFLSLILRHKPEKANIVLDEEGWVEVNELVKNTLLEWDEIEEIVRTDNKQRYSFNENHTEIRANQGHSLDEVDIKFEKVNPPMYLYHGTPTKNISSILKNGLNKGTRNYLHLSDDVETAEVVGSRRGDFVVLKIMAKLLHFDGHKFYISENGVYLTEFVPPEYIFTPK